MSMDVSGPGHSAGDVEMLEAASEDQELALGKFFSFMVFNFFGILLFVLIFFVEVFYYRHTQLLFFFVITFIG